MKSKNWWLLANDYIKENEKVFVVKQSQDMVNKTFRFPQELVERLEQVAKEQNVSVNSLVKQCCEYALGEMAQEDK